MKFFQSTVVKLFAALLIILAAATGAFSQSTSGSIFGRVTDASGAAVADAQVTATHESTGIVRTGTTEGSGQYTILNLPPGRYTVTVTKPGFSSMSQTGAKLDIEQNLDLEFQLKVGTVSSVEKVTADPIVLQTQSVETGEVIESRQILDLPLLGRNFLELTRLTPGVTSGGGGNTLNLAVNGGREFANSVLIDGVEATANRNNDTGLRPSVDAVEEFKVATSDYSAQYGRASGGSISIQTKSGSNGIHGSLYEFYRGNFTAARSYTFKNEPSEPSQIKQHNFGATLGGPIKKDKTFYFISMEATRQRNGSSFPTSVPPTNQIVFDHPNIGDVDLSGLVDPITGNQIPIYDPEYYAANFVAQQFPGNIIPADRVSPAGRAILQNFFPAPNLPGDSFGWYNNYQTHQPYRYNGKNGDVRVDHHFSDKDHLNAVYHYSDFNSFQADPFYGGTPVVGAGDVDQAGTNDARDQEISLTETHLFSSSLVNEFRFGYTRFALDQESLLHGKDYSTEFGVGNIAVPGFPSTMGFPVIVLGFGYQTGGSYYKPLLFTDQNFQFADNVTFSRGGKHEFRAGVDFRRLNSHPEFSLFPTGYQYFNGPYASFTSDPTYSNPDYNAAYGNGGSDIADLLLGIPGFTQIGLQLKKPHTLSWEFHFYGEDTYRVTPKLTLILGARFEFQNPYTEANNNSSVFDPVSGDILIAGRGGNSAALVNADKNNISPRIGFAYRVTDKTVIRAGYGLFYSPENDAREDVLTQNYPFAVQEIFPNDIYTFPVTYSTDLGVPRISSVPVDSSVSRIDPATIHDGNKQVVFYVDPNIRTGYTHAYNLTLERQITNSLGLSVAYVGTNSRKLSYSVGDVNAGGRLTSDLGKIQGLFSEGNGSYNSLQIKAKKQTGSLNFLASYTYGINIDNGPAPFNLGRGFNGPQDPYELGLEHAFADDDVRHNFVFSAIYPLPFGKGRRFFTNWSGPAQFVLGGWQVNGIFAGRTGLPVNIVRNGNGTGNTALRPNRIGDPQAGYSNRTLDHYFNTDAFCVVDTNPLNTCPAYGPNDIGSAGRNLIRGPGYANLDFSVFKDFAIRENMALQFRFEFFNLTNTPHFGNPDGDLNGKSVKPYDPNNPSANGDFGAITSLSGDPRIIQFALKFKF